MSPMTLEQYKGFYRAELRVLAITTGTKLTEPFLESVASQLAEMDFKLDALKR